MTKVPVPEWLLKNDTQVSQIKNSSHFLRKTLNSISDVIKNDFISEKTATANGFLQSVDARVKIGTLLFFILFGAFIRSIPVIAALAAVAVIYAELSGILIRDFFKRVWLYVPLIVFILSLPAASNLASHGSPFFYIVKSAHFATQGIYFTLSGISSTIRIALRCGVSLSFAYLLFTTTRFSELKNALHSLHVPSSFIEIFAMAYRYVFSLAEIAREITEARFVRTVGRLKKSDERRFLGHETAILFIRSNKMSGEVYDAMCCRCYTGNLTDVNDFCLKTQDFIFIINNVIIILILLLGVYLF